MRRLRITIVAILIATGASAQKRQATDYEVVHGWPIFPDGEMLGQATGVDVDSKGRVHVFHRAGRMWMGETFPTDPIARPTLAMFDPSTGRAL